MAVPEYIRKEDVPVFMLAAKHFNVYILVRKTNAASFPYIGQKEYHPKRLDCKAKTADLDAIHPKYGKKETAGLVVDPTIEGYGSAFATAKKAQSARTEWEKFKSHLYLPKPGDKERIYFPPGISYSVQMDPNHKHFGCVLLSPTGLATKKFYVHGDYDLYAVVPAVDPTRNERTVHEMYGMNHGRGRQTQDVQIFINRRIGVPMILHGENEKFMDHSDDNLLAFFPNGTVVPLDGEASIRKFYQEELKGRQAFNNLQPPSEVGFHKFHAR